MNLPSTAQAMLAQDVLTKLVGSGMDPIVIMARYATGDVVGLGFLTQEEYDEEPMYDEDDVVVEESGRDKALRMIPPKLRAEMAKELAQYIHAKKKPGDSSLEITTDENGGVRIYIPDNGRDPDIAQIEENPDD